MSGLKDLEIALKKAESFIKNELPEIIGIEAINEFQENFSKESFDGKPWKNVKRRNPSSSWYGFEYGSKTKKPNNHPSRKGAKKPYKPRKNSPITNYSANATKRKVLKGSSGDLQRSINYSITTNKVVVSSDKPYAKIHNEGGKIKVFGKKSVNMPKRKFIGKSASLERTIKKEIKKELNIIFSR